MDLTLLDQTLAAHGEPRFRAAQIWAWAAKGVEGYEQMTNLPSALRETLARELPFSSLTLSEEAHSSDGTIKALFQTADGRPIEAVLMRYRDKRRSICVSSQSGCPLTCTFCATGQMKFARNLTASEIVDQALHFRRIEPIDHCVFMGMGEPMLNLDSSARGLRTAAGHRHHPPAHRDLHRRLDPRHRTTRRTADATAPRAVAARGRRGAALGADARQRPLPAEGRARRLPRVLRAQAPSGVRRVRDARRRQRPLRAGLSRSPARCPVGEKARTGGDSIFKVNLIPYNPTDSPYEGSSRESIAAFRAALESRDIPVTVRLTRGRDIDAACGQLAAKAG